MTRSTSTRREDNPIPFSLPQVMPNEKRRAKRLLAALDEHYPDATCALDYTAPHELLIATILSAQCTDVAVNKATPALFAKFPLPPDYAASSEDEIEPYVKSLGFFRNKAKAVHASMVAVVEHHDGEVPQTMEQLLTLRGVARKTANVVLSNAFGIQDGVVVDTHVQRLARRLGLVDPGDSVAVIERRLMALFPRDRWGDLSHVLIWHGRGACSARRKACADHPICKGYGRACECRAG
ncbi:endonuclease III [Roseiflexus sp. AH-315-K22]|nr:endonuclease III [Roseiflexus sp. AH-315-K22]